MRPNNPNKRLRGRSKSKNSNPLARSYESNGPDVKIRGSALQVADKYAQLARDAQSSGDRVMAENYFQHAEHYYRIVAAAYEQQQQSKDRRDDQGDRPGRYDDRNDQPVVNGYDGVDDDEGVARTLRNGSRSGSDDQDEGDDEADHQPTRANGNHHTFAAQPEETGDSAASEAESQAEAAPEQEAKPKRRTRTTRSRRTRKSDGNGEAQGSSGETEAVEPTS
jgi:hypothetical protein